MNNVNTRAPNYGPSPTPSDARTYYPHRILRLHDHELSLIYLYILSLITEKPKYGGANVDITRLCSKDATEHSFEENGTHAQYLSHDVGFVCVEGVIACSIR